MFEWIKELFGIKDKGDYNPDEDVLCPVCGYYLFEDGPGSHEICPICYWEDDLVQYEDESYAGGANKQSLEQCKANYKLYGACDKRFVTLVRKPNGREIVRKRKADLE